MVASVILLIVGCKNQITKESVEIKNASKVNIENKGQEDEIPKQQVESAIQNFDEYKGTYQKVQKRYQYHEIMTEIDVYYEGKIWVKMEQVGYTTLSQVKREWYNISEGEVYYKITTKNFDRPLEESERELKSIVQEEYFIIISQRSDNITNLAEGVYSYVEANPINDDELVDEVEFLLNVDDGQSDIDDNTLNTIVNEETSNNVSIDNFLGMWKLVDVAWEPKQHNYIGIMDQILGMQLTMEEDYYELGEDIVINPIISVEKIDDIHFLTMYASGSEDKAREYSEMYSLCIQDTTGTIRYMYYMDGEIWCEYKGRILFKLEKIV